jgi:hypothetical protein
MRLRIAISVFIFMMVVGSLTGCSEEPVEPKLLESMVNLDRVYIPALLFTNLQKQRESEIAMERLKGEWDEFNQKYYKLEFKYGVDIVDKFWKEDFDKIGTLVSTAESFVNDKKLNLAHEELDGIRLVFMELRHRNGLDYFLDEMNDFHLTMEEILGSIKGKDILEDRDLEKLAELSKKALEKWSGVANAEIDAVAFDFDDKKIAAIRKRIGEEKEALERFAAALSADEEDEIFQAAHDIKPNFVVLYKAFGDFQPVFDRIIQERK